MSAEEREVARPAAKKHMLIEMYILNVTLSPSDEPNIVKLCSAARVEYICGSILVMGQDEAENFIANFSRQFEQGDHVDDEGVDIWARRMSPNRISPRV
jgi:hypothetical protein